MRTPSAAVIAAVLAAALSTGCSGGDEKPQALPTLSPSTTATPTVAPVEVPAAARERTPQGADAFVRFFFASLNRALRESDPTIIRALSDAACETCENYAEALEDRDDFIEGDTFTSVQVAVPPLSEPGTVADVTGVVPARRVLDSKGNVKASLSAEGRFHFEVNVQRRGDMWIVRGIRRAAQ